MISVSEASSIILSHSIETGLQEISIQEACGRILREEVQADRDFPPFDRVAMDGIAINSEIWKNGIRQFPIESIQAAGQQQVRLSKSDSCVEVMTGAMLPVGTDTVIRYEDLEIKAQVATVLITEIIKGDNIHRQSQDAKRNEALLAPGIKISPAEIALMASVGMKKVSVSSFPKTAIISTGDELIPVDLIPLPYQIRRSNSYALQAALLEAGCVADQFHIPDQPEILETEVRKILEHYQLIIFSGGVSKGKFDFVPQTLERNGIQKRFHQVSQKPGKPLWFGTSSRHVVFALPGNPVSTYMCFYRYIKPWLVRSLGGQIERKTAVLTKDFSFKPLLTYFLQVNILNEKGQLLASPKAGGGSGDFANLKDVHGFIELPAESSEFKAGQVFDYYPFRT
ncbi:MAG TPA: molybdopterin molybdotransferase MoeA [Cyclobacteriaceae bacterium]|nr:molybdopterin molybdotransferase MoeA [Cyclobacteriaceae bacterium]HPW60704.1 molybdopterin molybdotransferase MoeA [Cyclobacteriaceae bacterium]